MCFHEWAILHNDGSLECVACGHITNVQQIKLEYNQTEVPAANTPKTDSKEFEEFLFGLMNE